MHFFNNYYCYIYCYYLSYSFHCALLPLSVWESSHWTSDIYHALFIDLSRWSSNGCTAALKLLEWLQAKLPNNSDSYRHKSLCLLNRFNMCWRVEHRNTLKENPVKSEIQSEICFTEFYQRDELKGQSVTFLFSLLSCDH